MTHRKATHIIKRDRVPPMNEKLLPEILLKTSNRPRQRGLCDVEDVRCRRYRPLALDFDKLTQLLKFHICIPCLLKVRFERVIFHQATV